jgi:hypothetical protein
MSMEWQHKKKNVDGVATSEKDVDGVAAAARVSPSKFHTLLPSRGRLRVKQIFPINSLGRGDDKIYSDRLRIFGLISFTDLEESEQEQSQGTSVVRLVLA